MASLHPFDGWQIRPYFKRKHETPVTYQDIDEELWLILRHPTEVQDAGARLIAMHQASNEIAPVDFRLWREFRGYMRQAENFYRGAKVLPWQSSPLNYYYAFLNLAKAYCLIAGALPLVRSSPRATDLPNTRNSVATSSPRYIRHGLAEEVLAGSPDRWEVTVRGNDEVYALLYGLSLGVAVTPFTKLDVHDLLGYALPIGWQLNESGRRHRIRSIQCKWALFFEPGAWDVVGIGSLAPLDQLPSEFAADYELLDHHAIKGLARHLWSLDARETSEYRFFRRRVPQPPIEQGTFSGDLLQEALERSLPNRVFEYLSNTDFQFLLCLPCPTVGCAGAIPMNQEMASYATLFFLSSLVRYHPEYMNAIAETSDAWIIESFVKSAPLELLRSLTAKILAYTLVMRRG